MAGQETAILHKIVCFSKVTREYYTHLFQNGLSKLFSSLINYNSIALTLSCLFENFYIFFLSLAFS